MSDMKATYEVITPEGPCVGPYDHDLVEVVTYSSLIPRAAFCRRCGQQGTVVVFTRCDKVGCSVSERMKP